MDVLLFWPVLSIFAAYFSLEIKDVMISIIIEELNTSVHNFKMPCNLQVLVAGKPGQWDGQLRIKLRENGLLESAIIGEGV